MNQNNLNDIENVENQEKRTKGCTSQLVRLLEIRDIVFLIFALFCGIASSGLYPTAFWVYGNVIKLIVQFTSIKSSLSNSTFNNQSCLNRQIITENTTDLVSSISVYIYQYVYFGIAIFTTHFMAYILWGIVIERYTRRLRCELYKSLVRQEISWFDSFKLGECNVLYASIDKMKLAYGTKLIDFMILVTRAISCFIFAYYSCWKLALALTAVMPISIVFFVATIIFMKKYTIAENEAHSLVVALGQEVLTAIKVVMAYGGQKNEINNFDKLLNTVKNITIKKGTIVGITSGVAGFFNSASYAVLIGFGTYVYQSDCNFDSGNIIQTFAALIIATLAVSQALPFVKEFSEGRVASKRIFEILDKKSNSDVYDEVGITLNKEALKVKHDIEFQGLSFKYPSSKNKMALNDFNLIIKHGQTVGLIGASGCGKSTLTKLLMRIYEPTKGRIYYGNDDIKSLNLRWWRSQISIVSPDAGFFTMSIKENIRLSNPKASDDDIIKASMSANAHEFIQKLPQGYDTIIGTRNGRELSGGQKQRISIARAFLKNSKILILDEATSALDNNNERLVQESFERLKRGRTTIVIAHRLSTIRDADMIIEMQNGEITDSGTHDELVKHRGFYYKLLKAAQINQVNKNDEKSQSNETINTENAEDVEIKVIDNIENRIEEEKKIKNLQLRVWQLNKSELIWIIVTGLASLVQGAIYPMIAFSFCQLIEIFSLNNVQKQTNQSLIYTSVVLAIAVLSFFAQFFQSFASTKSGAELTTRVKHMLFESLIYKDYEYFTIAKHKPHLLISQISSKAPLLKGYTTERVAITLNFISSVGIPVTTSLVFSWKLALVISLFIPIALIWGLMQGQFLRSSSKLIGASTLKESIDIASETVDNIYTVTLYNLQHHFVRKLKQMFHSNFNRILLIMLIEALFYGLGYTLYFFVQAATFKYGSVLLQTGEIEAKVMIFIFLSMLFSSMYLGKNISTLPDVPKARKAAEWVFNVIDSDKPIIEADNKNGVIISNFKGNVELIDVHFKYPNSNIETLKGINLKFNSGQLNVLVGNSGGGKSTVISLIQRHYDVTSGIIKIDDIDIKNLNVRWLRSKIGIVFQEPILFNRTIKENITYGMDPQDITIDKIYQAATKSAIHNKIMELPKNYDTLITTNMLNFSSGEKQRIAIARALIREPKILLLDEASSALDSISEKHFQSLLEQNFNNHTSIMISHRLSSIVNAKKIAVIKDGILIEEGDHLTLMNKQSFYSELQSQQTQLI